MRRARLLALAALVVLSGCGGNRKISRSSTPARPSTGTTATTVTPTSSASNVRTVGQLIDTQFGPIQVAAVMRQGRLVDVVALYLPSDRPRSMFISQQAEPLLHQEALQAQSAQINVLSGATYTSEAYAQSLQSALTRARLATP